MARSNLVQSLERGLDILERVAQSGRNGTGVRDVALALGLKAPTAHNLMRTLTARGYLRRTSAPVRYHLGPRARALARSADEEALPAMAEQELLALHAGHPDTVFTLSRASARSVGVVLRVSPDDPGRIQRPPVHTLGPYGSASALLFQAYWPAEQRDAFAAQHPFWDHAAPLWKTPEALAGYLQEVRRSGVAVTHFPGEAILKIAAPVLAADGAIAAAVGGSTALRGLTAIQRGRLIADVKAAAQRLSNQEAPPC